MGKGDHPRNWAHQLPRTEYAKRIEAIDWQDTDQYDDPGALKCLSCGAIPAKMRGRYCDNCDSTRIESLRRRNQPR